MRNYITYRIRTWKNRITVTTDKLECWTGNMCNQKFMNSHVNSLFGVLDEKKGSFMDTVCPSVCLCATKYQLVSVLHEIRSGISKH